MQRVARQVALSRPNGLGSASRLQHLLPQKVSSRAVRGFHARSSPLRAQTDPTYTNATAKPQIIALPPKRSRLRKWIVRFARTTLFVVLGTTGYVLVRSYQQRHPGDQLDHEEGKRNLVVLGNGWASTAFLKSLDTTEYNVTVISPRNYFTFTPLLPSCSVGTIENRSIMEPTRFITRHKARKVNVYEGNATQVDPIAKTVTFLGEQCAQIVLSFFTFLPDHSEIKGDTTETTVSYDDLVYAVGAESNTFGIPGVKEHACFLKEVWDTTKIRRRLMECASMLLDDASLMSATGIEGATFKDQSESEIDRLLHMVVVGGGPTGVEYAAELHASFAFLYF
jgi:NADH:ubiquinone reductase (non-electrogenic)